MRSVAEDKELRKLFKSGRAEWILAPNDVEGGKGSPYASRARHHGDFDDDELRLQATLARILGLKENGRTAFHINRSQSGLRDQRHVLQGATDDFRLVTAR